MNGNAHVKEEKTQTRQQILDGYMAALDKLSSEYEEACDDPQSADWYIFYLENSLEKLEALAYLYMNIISGPMEEAA